MKMRGPGKILENSGNESVGPEFSRIRPDGGHEYVAAAFALEFRSKTFTDHYLFRAGDSVRAFEHPDIEYSEKTAVHGKNIRCGHEPAPVIESAGLYVENRCGLFDFGNLF